MSRYNHFTTINKDIKAVAFKDLNIGDIFSTNYKPFRKKMKLHGLQYYVVDTGDTKTFFESTATLIVYIKTTNFMTHSRPSFVTKEKIEIMHNIQSQSKTK